MRPPLPNEPRDIATDFTICNRAAFIPRFLAATDGELNLHFAAREVQAQGDKREPLFGSQLREMCNLLSMQ